MPANSAPTKSKSSMSKSNTTKSSKPKSRAKPAKAKPVRAMAPIRLPLIPQERFTPEQQALVAAISAPAPRQPDASTLRTTSRRSRTA